MSKSKPPTRAFTIRADEVVVLSSYRKLTPADRDYFRRAIAGRLETIKRGGVLKPQGGGERA